MDKDFLGRGWKFPIELDVRGAIKLSEYEQKIRESIMIILGTAKGERVMRPEFGCEIHNFAFEIINASTLTLIKSSVREALILWEPRIEVLNIETNTEKLQQGQLLINVYYRVRTTNNEFNLVYPFNLKSGG